jgi:hypothetical protein
MALAVPCAWKAVARAPLAIDSVAPEHLGAPYRTTVPAHGALQ